MPGLIIIILFNIRSYIEPLCIICSFCSLIFGIEKGRGRVVVEREGFGVLDK